MLVQKIEIVEKLNRVNLLYNFAVSYSKPYRIGKIKSLFNDALLEASKRFIVRELNDTNYSEVIDISQNLETIISKKHEAIVQQDYEIALMFRNKEKEIVRKSLEALGVKLDARYSVINNCLYWYPCL